MKDMKKKFIICFAALLLILPLNCLAGAEGQQAVPFVRDEAGLLTQEQLSELEQQAEATAGRYGCATYILTVEDFRELGLGDDIFEAAMDIYEQQQLGQGVEKNGILLMLSMEGRDYALASYGQLSHKAFTDYGQDYMEERFLDCFSQDDWSSGFKQYLTDCAWLLEQEAKGLPYDVGTAPKGFNWLIIIIPLLAAAAVCGVLAAQMKTARLKTEARDYVAENGVRMDVVQDRFSHRSVVRTKIEKKTSGGGTTVNSRGFSGGSGKF